MKLKDEIYKRGYNLNTFAEKCCISRFTLMRVFKNHTARGTTIYAMSNALNLSYEKVKELIEV